MRTGSSTSQACVSDDDRKVFSAQIFGADVKSSTCHTVYLRTPALAAIHPNFDFLVEFQEGRIREARVCLLDERIKRSVLRR